MGNSWSLVSKTQDGCCCPRDGMMIASDVLYIQFNGVPELPFCSLVVTGCADQDLFSKVSLSRTAPDPEPGKVEQAP